MSPNAGARFTLFKARAHKDTVPLTVHLELTYACNWRCAFCCNPRHSDVDPLSLREWLCVLDDLRALGTLFVTLTGGEPLRHPSFFEIARGARERHLAVRVFTNGSLIDEATADALAETLPLSIELSLHGAEPDTHDRTTGVPGSFASLWRGIDHLRERGLPLVLRTPITSLNEHEIDRTIELAEALDIPLRIDPTLAPRDNGSLDPLGLLASRAGVERLMERLAAVNTLPTSERVRGGSNCGVGRSTLAIDPEGTVFPCIQWRHAPMGNIRETPLVELWPGSTARLEAAATAVEVNSWLLAEGGATAAAPYCPGEAVLRAGSPFAASAGFRLQAQLADRFRRDR